MMNLILKFECLDGIYNISITPNDSLINYEVETNISYLENKSGSIETKDFIDRLNKIPFNKWNKEYQSNIEDGVKWNINYINDNNSFQISGSEGNWPYEYDELIKLVSLLDSNIEMFIANKK